MKLTNEKEVTRIIIDLINKLHPVKTPRIDLNIPSFKRPATDIIINLVEEENLPYTYINILDGTQSFKESIEKGKILISNYLDNNTLKELMDFLFLNFPIIYNFNVNENSISLDFSFSKNDDFLKKSGISLENINLEINISDLKLNHKIKNYLLFILNTYHKELNQTSFWQENMQKYKEKLIFEMEYKYIMDFLSYLNEDEIRKLLGNINNERFIEIINNINSKETKLERLLP